MADLRTTDAVNLRDRPGTSGTTVLATVPVGAAVEALEDRAWRRVRWRGREGWMAADFLAPAEISPPRPPARYTFDPTTPTELQVQPWTCSIRSVMWLLKSIGIAVTADEAQDAMAPAYVNPDVGLKDASGAGIVEVLRDRWGVTAFNRAPVSFDEVAGWAGQMPVAIGGRGWGHWTAVRCNRVDPTSDEVTHLLLANPGGTGPRYGQQALDRRQFADLGWFSAVVIPLD